MTPTFVHSTRRLLDRVTQFAQRLLDGAPSADDEADRPSPAARIDHPTYLRRRIAIDGVTGPCPDDWDAPDWQVRLSN